VFQEVVGPVQSELAIPMIFKGALRGVLDLKSSQPHAFDANDMGVLETVSFQLAVALENVRLFESVRHRVAQLELIQGITNKAIENLDIESILAFALEATCATMGYSGVAIGLITEDRQSVELTGLALGLDGNLVLNAARLPLDDSTVIGSVARTGQA